VPAISPVHALTPLTITMRTTFVFATLLALASAAFASPMPTPAPAPVPAPVAAPEGRCTLLPDGTYL
jgi:hypothetical protein